MWELALDVSVSNCQNTIVDQKCQSNWMSNVKPPRNETSAIGFESLPEDMAWFSVYHFPMFSYWCSLFIWGGVPCLVKWSVASWVPALQLVVGFPWCHLWSSVKLLGMAVRCTRLHQYHQRSWEETEETHGKPIDFGWRMVPRVPSDSSMCCGDKGSKPRTVGNHRQNSSKFKASRPSSPYHNSWSCKEKCGKSKQNIDVALFQNLKPGFSQSLSPSPSRRFT